MYYSPLDVVVCGSFRRGADQLRADCLELRCAGANITSPVSIDFVSGHEDGFVRAAHELETPAPDIEGRHLEEIVRASLIWLHLPGGHLGLSAAVELGFARALGVPVYARELPGEPGLDWMIRKVPCSSAAIVDVLRNGESPAGHGLGRLQSYYRRTSERRGWAGESVGETVEMLRGELEEFEAAEDDAERRLEYADIQLYVTHLGNQAGIDADEAVVAKESINARRFG